MISITFRKDPAWKQQRLTKMRALADVSGSYEASSQFDVIKPAGSFSSSNASVAGGGIVYDMLGGPEETLG